MDPNYHPEAESLLDAGASSEFVTVMLAEPDTHEGVERSSVRQLVRKYDDPEELADRGGDFAGNLWDGNMAEAFYHADIDNTKLLLDIFGPNYLWAEGVREGEPSDHFRRILHEKVERYRPHLLAEVGPKPERA